MTLRVTLVPPEAFDALFRVADVRVSCSVARQTDGDLVRAAEFMCVFLAPDRVEMIPDCLVSERDRRLIPHERGARSAMGRGE